MPAEPKPETQQRAQAVILVDRTPDCQSPRQTGHRLAPNGGEGHRARCGSGGEISHLTAQHVAEVDDTDSGTASPAGTGEVCTKNGESQTEIPAGQYLSPPEVARLVPGGTSDEAVYRWIKRGVLFHGRRVKLAAIRVGGRWQVSRAALHVFLSTINPGMRGPVVGKEAIYGAPPVPATGPRRARQLALVRERLKAMGV